MLVVGATSDIAKATARAFAKAGWGLTLAGRDGARLKDMARDLEVRGGKPVRVCHFDALEPASAPKPFEGLDPLPDALLVAVGLLGDQDRARSDPDLALKINASNYSGLLPLLMEAADAFEKRGSGTIIGIGSVAGDRGRASNYTYGAAKAALDAYLSGLRNRLFPKGVRVLTVKPGFVRTPMTEGLELPEGLTATAGEVGDKIYKAFLGKKDVLYVKWQWRWIMLAIRSLPEFVFKRTKL
jgi:short-subunit dehydrogenase